MLLTSFAKRFRRGQRKPRQSSSITMTEDQNNIPLPRLLVTTPSAPQLSSLSSALSRTNHPHTEAEGTEDGHDSVFHTYDNVLPRSSPSINQINRLSGVSWLSISVADDADYAVTEMRELEVRQAKIKHLPFMEASLQLSQHQASLEASNNGAYFNQSKNEVFEGVDHLTIPKNNAIDDIKHMLNDVVSLMEDIKVTATDLIGQETIMVDSKVATTLKRRSAIGNPHIKKEVDEGKGDQDQQQTSTYPSRQDLNIKGAKEQRINLKEAPPKRELQSPTVKLEDNAVDGTAGSATLLPQSMLKSHESLMRALIHIHVNAILALNELRDVMNLLDE